MILHTSLGGTTFKRNRLLKILLDKGAITFAGNARLKIYGTLTCSSGKRMKPGNRVLFNSEVEAIALHYRPCGHCMRGAYKLFKAARLNDTADIAGH